MAGPAYQWGHWRFEPSECRLLRNGEVVPLPAKTLDLLQTLLNRAPRLITKEEILSAVWCDAAVEEGNIAFHIAALRKVLDEDGGDSTIETVRGRGYRFVRELTIHQLPPTEDLRREALERAIAAAVPPPPASVPFPAAPPTAPPPVTASQQPEAPKARGGRTAFALLVAAAVVALGIVMWQRSQPQPWSVAVEHFQIIDPPPDQQNFPDGLRAYVVSRLQLSGVTTAEIDVATARLSGQLRPVDGGFSVDVQLTHAASGTRVWNWTYEVPRDINKPTSGEDDARSRLQTAIADRAAEGISRYLSLAGAAPVTR